MVNILILAAGKTQTECENEIYPICLTEINGVSLLERIISNTYSILEPRYTFALLKSEEERYHLSGVANLLVECPKIVLTPEISRGSACTALMASCSLPQDEELLIVSANELVDINLADVTQHFYREKVDGGVLIFRSVHPRYSYVRLNTERLVTEVAQQKPISHNATAGIFWFKRTSDFVDAVKASIRKGAHVRGKFYVAPAYNELILKGQRVGVFELDSGQYLPLKNYRQIQQFEQGRFHEIH